MAVHMQPGVKWVWKDDTQSLEPVSTQSLDRQDRRRDRRQKGGHFQDHSKRSERGGATPSLKSYGVGRGRQSRGVPGHRSPRQGAKHGSEHNFVTLDDVKALALEMLSEVEDVAPNFEELLGTKQFDKFLMWMLNYFHTFNEKRAHEQKPNPMNMRDNAKMKPKKVKIIEHQSVSKSRKKKSKKEPSLAEKKYYADLCGKMEAAQKQLGQSYCVLVLGIGLDHQHHMSCGQSRVSSTYKDRGMYETLYSFCTFVVWITFRRKDYEIVKKEIGRILRSDTFNPAIRVKNAPEPEPALQDGQEKKEKAPEKKLTPAEYRRLHGKRPAIKSIINQRSPALVSILPQPSEAAHWLFKRADPTSMSGQVENIEDETEEAMQNMQLTVGKFKLGIIGEPLSAFNPQTLTPLGADNEDEENTEEEKEPSTNRRERFLKLSQTITMMRHLTKWSHPAASGPGKTPQSGQGISRQVTGISTATTEALSDDE